MQFKMLGLSSAFAFAFVAGGCATNHDHRAALAERDAFADQAKKFEAVAYSARAEAQVYKAQLQAKQRDDGSKDGTIAALQKRNRALETQLDSVNGEFQVFKENANRPLPSHLEGELENFARNNPELLSYDREAGVIRFASDVTFGPGSAELTGNAAQAAKSLAGILNGSSAREFDLMVTGHTDNKPVTKSETIRKGHKDNWYLSSHRAIAVGEALRDAGVNATRIAVVGYADQRPAATNTTANGRATNRRVEVVIVPAASHDAMAGKPRFEDAFTAPIEFMKQTQTATTDRGFAFEK